MNLSSILLKCVSKMDGERTLNASLHILRGKRSGQSLQDVHHFQLQGFFGILPKLSETLFTEAASLLFDQRYIHKGDNNLIAITSSGKQAAEKMPQFSFNGINYQGRELLFFGRVSLLVQTLSYLQKGEKTFLPMQRDPDIQWFVKALIMRERVNPNDASVQVGNELRQLLAASRLTDEQKIIFTHRLTGFQLPGKTWEQLGEYLHLPVLDTNLLFVESLHILLDYIEITPDLIWMKKMADQIKVKTYLTDSSQKTKYFFEQGMEIDSIAAVRQLKVSTIEDHFVEMAIHDPMFPLQQFVSKQDIQHTLSAAKQLGTMRLRPLKEQLPDLSYFQLRLILAARTGEDA